MASSTVKYKQIPWTGGLNTAVDPGIVPPTDLVQADNVTFSSSGARVKREAFEYFDAASAIPASTKRSSSGTIRTIVLDGNLQDGTSDKLVVGEAITITSTGSEPKYTGNAVVLTIGTTDVANDTITYHDPDSESLTEGTTATTTLTVARNHNILAIKDYWYLDSSSVKTQLIMVLTSQVKLFKYNTSGNRIEILPGGGTKEVTTLALATETGASVNGKYFRLRSWNYTTDVEETIGFWYDTDDSGTSAPSTSADRDVEITTVVAGDTDAQVAAKTATAVAAEYNFTASAATSNVTITEVVSRTHSDTIAEDLAAGTLTTTTPGVNSVDQLTDAITQATMTTMNERLIISFDGVNNSPFKYNPDDAATFSALGGSPPNASAMRVHQGRLWANDNTNPDRLHYSSPGNHEEWGGVGDSGAIDIGTGDGDAGGIIGIFPTFKGRLIVGKRGALYQIIGDAPEHYEVSQISNGVGVSSHDSIIAVDQDDIIFMSDKGIHSMAATAAHGDFSGTFLSAKIQPTFNNFVEGSLGLAKGAYIPELNSIAFAVREAGQTENNDVYLYNTNFQAWYKWPDVSCISIATQSQNQKKRLLFGTTSGRIIRAQTGDYTDYGTDAIIYKIKTGTIYPDSDPTIIKGFKRLGFLFKPLGRFTFTAKVKVDNEAKQALAFIQEIDGDDLGTEFVLGSSVLGVDQVTAMYNQSIDGYGRGIQIEVEQTGTGEQVEIQGFMVEYEPGDTAQETLTGG